MRSQEFTGKTTQEAIDNGLAALGVTIADVHVDVIQEGAKGLFGLFGSKPACVRLTILEDEKEEDHGLSDLLSSFSISEPRRKPAPKPEKKPEAKKPEAKKPEAKAEAPKAEPPKAEAKKPEAPKPPKADKKIEKQAETVNVEAAQKAGAPKDEAAPRAPREKKPRAPKPEKKAEAAQDPREYAPMIPARPFTPDAPPVIHPEDTPAGRAQRFLMDVTCLMNVQVDVYVDDAREDGLYIHMIGDKLGVLIGRRGETLDALQYLTSLQVNKGREGYIRVTLDTENYRARREDSLRRLAQRMANRAQKTGRKVVLEPMNPYERRVLHTALQNHPSVSTHSEGEEPNRRVVIVPANLPERPQQAEGARQAEGGEKPSSARRRSSRRGRGRGAKAAAQANGQAEAAPQETVPAAPVAQPE